MSDRLIFALAQRPQTIHLLVPPRTVRPEPNMMVRYCDNYGLSDMTGRSIIRLTPNGSRCWIADAWFDHWLMCMAG